MDFKLEVRKLVRQIPKGKVSTPGALANSLGDPRARKAILELVKSDHEVRDKIVASKIVTDNTHRKLLIRRGINFVDERIYDFEKIIFKDFSSSYPLKKLKDEQYKLSKKIILDDDFETPERICGVDVAYAGDTAFCALVIINYDDMELMELKTKKTQVVFPYIPTYLAYREFDAIKILVKNLKKDKDVLLVDASGILHPRGLGLASHVGIKLDLITIGVTKSLLCGKLEKTPERIGTFSEIIYKDEIRGYGLKTSESKKLIYVSPGHRISLETSLSITKKISFKRIPEPLRLTHINAKKFKLAS